MDYVAGFLFGTNKDKSGPSKNEVLLIRKARPAWQSGKLNGIGGHIEPGEIPSHAMVREFREETGLDTFQTDWLHKATLLVNGEHRVEIFSMTSPMSLYSVVIKEKMAPPPTNAEPLEIHDLTYRDDQGPLPLDLAPWGLCMPTEMIEGLDWLIPLCRDGEVVGPVVIKYGQPAAQASS